MGNERRNWHRRWVVDLAASTASHESGLAVAFTTGIQMPRPVCACYSYADGVGEWTGLPARGGETLRDWLRLNPHLQDVASINSRLGRLMEEAGRVWARAKADEFRGRSDDE